MYRFALSPAEDIHVNTLRVALFTYLCAQKEKARFLVRIEGVNTGKDQEMLALLATFGITYDALYYQRENLKFHHQCAAALLSNGKAFSCFCAEESLAFKRELARNSGTPYRYDGACEHLSDAEVLDNQAPFTVRIKAPQGALTFTDALRGEILLEENDSFVLLHHDKSPAYDFACAVDDMLQGVRFVFCEEDFLSSAPKQAHIRHSLGFTEPMRYAHVPAIKETTSGQEDALSVTWLLAQGFLPHAISNYLICLGNTTPCEVFTLEEALAWFDPRNLSAPCAPFDIEALRHLNREHLLRMDDALLASLLDFSGADFGKLAKFYTQEASTLQELKPKLHAIFSPKVVPEGCEAAFTTLQNALLQAPHFETFEALKTHLGLTCKLEGDHLITPLRALLTGLKDGPDLGALYPLITPYLKEIVRS